MNIMLFPIVVFLQITPGQSGFEIATNLPPINCVGIYLYEIIWRLGMEVEIIMGSNLGVHSRPTSV